MNSLVFFFATLVAANSVGFDIRIASLGDQSLVVWKDSSATIWARRISDSGSLLDSEPLRIGSAGTVYTTIQLIAAAGNYWIAWGSHVEGESDRVLLRRVHPDGTIEGMSIVSIGTAGPLLIGSDGSAVVDVVRTGDTFAFIRFEGDGRLTDRQNLSFGIPADQIDLAAIASNGDMFLIAMREWAGPHRVGSPSFVRIAAARLTADGLLLDPLPIAISSEGIFAGDVPVEPCAASDGRDFLITYRRLGFAQAKRLLREGALADSTAEQAGRVISAGSNDALVPSARGYIALLSTFPPLVTTLVELDRAGEVLRPIPTQLLGGHAGIARSGEMYCVAYADGKNVFVENVRAVPRVRAVHFK